MENYYRTSVINIEIDPSKEGSQTLPISTLSDHFHVDALSPPLNNGRIVTLPTAAQEYYVCHPTSILDVELCILHKQIDFLTSTQAQRSSDETACTLIDVSCEFRRARRLPHISMCLSAKGCQRNSRGTGVGIYLTLHPIMRCSGHSPLEVSSLAT